MNEEGKKSGHINHWLENSRQNLLPLSNCQVFSEALSEWSFTGQVFDSDEVELICELCEHPELAHHFQIQNSLNGNQLLVGSSCILKFSEIAIENEGRLITDKEERKVYLEVALEQQLRELMLEPLRALWKLNEQERDLIEHLALRLKADVGVSPQELLFLFESMEKYEVKYSAKHYKVSLRSLGRRSELEQLSKGELIRINPALSVQQRKKFQHLFIGK